MLQYDRVLNMLNEKKLQGLILYASIYGKYRHKHIHRCREQNCGYRTQDRSVGRRDGGVSPHKVDLPFGGMRNSGVGRQRWCGVLDVLNAAVKR